MVVGEELTERRRGRKIFRVCGESYVEDGGATKNDSPTVGLGRPITSEDQLVSFMYVVLWRSLLTRNTSLGTTGSILAVKGTLAG
jgi:hypothetical protein